MDINQALTAQKLKRPVVLSIPFLGDIEYERILSIHSHLPRYKINTAVAILKDKCGHSVTAAGLNKIRLKEPVKTIDLPKV
nr:MAG TPA: hypothetical protein [Caudoviricetes sp.]